MIVTLKMYNRPKDLIDTKDPAEFTVVTMGHITQVSIMNLDPDEEIAESFYYLDPEDKYLIVCGDQEYYNKPYQAFRWCDVDIVLCSEDD